MTNKEKQQIQQLRAKGLGYGKIAEALGLSKSTVSSFCKSASEGSTFCLLCGEKLKQTKGHRQKKFCSGECKNRYWKIHKSEIKKNMTEEHKCEGCGEIFFAYKSKKQKFCSVACYRKSRFGGQGK